MGEHIVHESLVGGPNVLEAGRHGIVVVVSMISHEGILEAFRGSIQIWLYPKYVSMKLNVRYPKYPFLRRSMFDSGYMSFG